MENVIATQEIMEIRERMSRCEEKTDSLSKQYEAITNIAESLQQLTLNVQSINDKSDNIDKRLCNIEIDKKSKTDYIWNTVVGLFIGGMFGYMMQLMQ